MSNLGLSFDSTDPALGTGLGIGDVEPVLSNYLANLVDSESGATINLDTAVTLGGLLDLHAALSSAQLADVTDQAVAGEKLRKDLSEVLSGAVGKLAVGASRDQLGIIRQLDTNLKKYQRTPFADIKKARDDQLALEERARKVNQLNGSIVEIETTKYGFTGKSLKEKTYRPDNVTRDGKWLKREIASVEGDSGSGKPLFREEEAHILAGLSLSVTDEAFIKGV